METIQAAVKTAGTCGTWRPYIRRESNGARLCRVLMTVLSTGLRPCSNRGFLGAGPRKRQASVDERCRCRSSTKSRFLSSWLPAGSRMSARNSTPRIPERIVWPPSDTKLTNSRLRTARSWMRGRCAEGLALSSAVCVLFACSLRDLECFPGTYVSSVAL